MKKLVLLLIVICCAYLLSGCGSGPESRYIGEWSNDGLHYGTIVLEEKNKCELKGFQGQTCSTTWKLGDSEGHFIQIGDGKNFQFKASIGVTDSSVLLVNMPQKTDLYMYRK